MAMTNAERVRRYQERHPNKKRPKRASERPESLQDRIRSLMQQRSLSEYALAVEMQLPYAMVTDLLAGRAALTPVFAGRLTRVFGQADWHLLEIDIERHASIVDE